MKKIISAALFSSLICLTVFASLGNPLSTSGESVKVVNVLDISESDLNKLKDGEMGNVAVEFSKGTQMPIKFFLSGELIKLLVDEKTPSKLIEIKTTFYVRFVNDGLIFSTNLSEWKPFMEFITGNASVEIGTQNGKRVITSGAEINLK
ncbi:MAG: hypothetical protein H0W88_08195 [Parachlamydiaceae bacterium]|nr:hypothetical protein [Parachlamydiaceae bacterium]